MEEEHIGTDGVQNGQTNNGRKALFGVFDGMGGEECGEVASYIAAKTMSEMCFFGNPEKEMRKFCRESNRRICRFIEENNLFRSGTTAAVLQFSRRKICLCNIGDSKIYRFSDRKLVQISRDHVVSAVRGGRTSLTQNLGIPEEEMRISPYVISFEYEPDTDYLICSDGLTDMVSTEEIETILSGSNRISAAEALLEAALEHGGRDNVTFILLHIVPKKR